MSVVVKLCPAFAVLVEIGLMTGALVIVRVKLWVAVPALLLALKVRAYTPAADPLGVPEMVALHHGYP